MSLRVILSKLASAEARHTAAHILAMVCAVGFLMTLVVMFATGMGLRRWFFALLAWTLFAYLPLRILLEAFQTIAPRMRRKLITQTAAQTDRYARRASVELIVDSLFEGKVVMPRITTPAQSAKTREGAVAILLHTGSGEDSQLREAATRCLATVERWVTNLASWSARNAPTNIQARWMDLRALAALAAMAKVLIAAYDDRFGQPYIASGVDAQKAEDYLDACLDYCDQLALEVEVAPWGEASLPLMVEAAESDQIREAWKTFCATVSPALESRQAFVNALLIPLQK